ncbi:nitrate reductase molybdenum cofactor assembly chaperone [Staphylococcus saccharolyticus]|uniref:nitrate reductase molybdenum cofactor assembly chaperone n=1 Tax=Staphylococcus saccharolyticus TaxID=33028 RepID=UPI00102D6EDD|nr:nitrate reductase molybdenum cofactor assembly chaperone [Staphylococcus saccharolyticus]MBL7573671.1 nitrate reductase molybdenum cofactor assembly chaperone [Staphylococcus saccharolyticus]MBL7584539.1 nitrate reductase molybdenum cofactor assembly chaperone [Staphylococcus saccharolyticus]QRJ68718.1 nitrate reductase molybdenum cofactor assembly chaperone [Staphylococcus saccharolyticus]TAA92035.1 nitrate reductase molybdenum cofactor assembly chaperone [Staphylococcus saccharolyticus]TA
MINLEKLSQYQESLGYLGQQMNFPEKMTFHPKLFEDTITTAHPGYEDLVAYREIMMNYTLSEIKAIYTDTFDFSKKNPLYMTFNKFDTQKERGQMLAKLKVLYEMFGLKMVDNELSDYLPLMLQFLQVADFSNDDRAQENLQLVIMIIEDGTYEMANALAKNNNPYAFVVSALRKTLKACIMSSKEVGNHA